jgi:hypothetical protein
MRTFMPAIAMAALVGCCNQADAQAQCPELTQLRRAASKVMPGLGLCGDYIHSVMAWDDALGYARDHREACDISGQLLGELAKYRGEAARRRDNVCAGRPVMAFPAEVIGH